MVSGGFYHRIGDFQFLLRVEKIHEFSLREFSLRDHIGIFRRHRKGRSGYHYPSLGPINFLSDQIRFLAPMVSVILAG